MASTAITPTRMVLNQLKGRLKTARRGHKLLKDKRDELMRQFDAIINIFDSQMQIVRKLHAAIEQNQTNPYSDSHDLSERERDVLILVAKGLSNKEIADRLNISIHTVMSHRKNITHKTGIKSVAGLTVYALLNNLVDQNDMTL